MISTASPDGLTVQITRKDARQLIKLIDRHIQKTERLAVQRGLADWQNHWRDERRLMRLRDRLNLLIARSDNPAASEAAA